MKLIGLTGGIASGKSTVAEFLRQQGYTVLSADQIARDIVQPGQPALQEIVETFGSNVLHSDGTLNRSALGSLIFADPSLRTQLEAITHPRIAQTAVELFEAYRNIGHTILFYEVPLLFETSMQSIFHSTILVSTPTHKQLERIQQRDGLTLEDAQRRIDSQMPLEEKAKLATYQLENNGTLQQLQQNTNVIIKMITNCKNPS